MQSTLIKALAEPHRKAEGNPSGWHHRVHPFIGGAGECLSWDDDGEGVSEVWNDIDSRLLTYYKVVQDREKFERFSRLAALAPVSQQLWSEARDYFALPVQKRPKGVDDCQQAYYFFVLVRQSMGKRMDSFAPLSKSRLRRKMNEQASAWLGAVEGLPELHERLQRVVLLNDDALAVCKREDSPHSLFICDAPYVKSTRTAPEVYTFEYSDEDHAALLDWAVKAKGYVMLCGYSCELYESRLADWRKHSFEMAVHSGKSDVKRRVRECLWVNFDLKKENK